MNELDLLPLDFIDTPLPYDHIDPPSRHTEHLPLNELNWKTFEVLVARLADIKFERAQLYGKQGSTQHGIDIFAFNPGGAAGSNSRNVYIQCKYVEEFTATNLQKAATDFLEGKFGTNVSTFIICLKKSIVDYRGLQDAYIKTEEEMDQKGILFVIWDAGAMEEMMRSEPQLVYDIFDRDHSAIWTRRFCGDALTEYVTKRYADFKKKDPAPVKNYIKRNVYFHDPNSQDLYSRYKRTYTDLFSLVTSNESKKIFLLSVAGAGKSAELQQLEYDLSNRSTFFPIRISLQNYTDQEFEDFISSYDNFFKTYNHAKIVLLLDGYDEVPSLQLDTMLRKLNVFANEEGKYRYIKIVLSSRSNFYKTKFEGFEPAYLQDLNENQIKQYVQETVGRNFQFFLDIIEQRKLNHLLTNAFNLIQFVKIYQKDGVINFPKNKAEAFERIIEIKLKEDIDRYDTTGIRIEEFQEAILEDLTKLAFSMEQLGTNHIKESTLKEIIPDHRQRMFLKYCFLMNKNISNIDEYQFEHNNFQEFLAAKVLSKLSFEEIKPFISFAPNHEKLKPRWVNTISLLISILDPNALLHQQLLSWLVEIEPEVITKFESSLIAPSTRIKILKSIYKSYEAREMVIYNEYIRQEELAVFAGDEEEFVDYLVGELVSRYQEPHLINILTTLRYIPNLYSCKNFTESALIAILNESKWSSYVQRDAVQCLLAHDSSAEMLDNIISNIVNFTSFDARQPIHELLMDNPLSEKYVGFLLDSVLLWDDGKLRYTTWYLTKAIHACKSPISIKQILSFLTNNYQKTFADSIRSAYRDEDIVGKELVANCIKAYEFDNTIFDYVLDLIRCIDNHHENERIKVWAIFFEQTNTSTVALKKLLEERNSESTYILLGAVLSRDCFDLISEYYKANLIDKRAVWDALFGISVLGKKDLQDEFYTFINEKTHNEFLYAEQHSWQEIEAKKHGADLILLKSWREFADATGDIFDAFEQDNLTKDDLYSYRKKKFSEEGLPHSVPLYFLQSLSDKTNTVNRDYALSYFNEETDWKWYVIGHLIRMLENGKRIDEWHKDYLISFCNEKLHTANFRSAIKDVGEDRWNYNELENRIVTIWKHLDFSISEDILLDMLAMDFSGVAHKQIDNKTVETIVDYVAKRVGDRNKLEGKIVQLLKDPQVSQFVRPTLIRLCGDLELRNTCTAILHVIQNRNISNWCMTYAIDIYRKLGGIDKMLLPLLNEIDLTEHWHWQLVGIFKKDYSSKVVETVKRCRANGTVPSEEKINSLSILISIGDTDAWTEFVEVLMTNQRIYHTLIRELELTNLSAQEVSTDLFSVLEHNQRNGLVNRDDRDGNSVTELLWNLALSSEEGFKVVNNGFKQFIAKLKDEFPVVTNFNYTQAKLERTYYLNKGDKIELKDVISNNQLVFAS